MKWTIIAHLYLKYCSKFVQIAKCNQSGSVLRVILGEIVRGKICSRSWTRPNLQKLELFVAPGGRAAYLLLFFACALQ